MTGTTMTGPTMTGPTMVTERELRRLTGAGVLALVVLCAYWTLWFTARSVVASSTTAAYVEFEDAFPLADAWLGVATLLSVRAVRAGRATALLWLLTAGGAGIYLFCMDVLYDLEHGIYAAGAAGSSSWGSTCSHWPSRPGSCAGPGAAATPSWVAAAGLARRRAAAAGEGAGRVRSGQPTAARARRVASRSLTCSVERSTASASCSAARASTGSPRAA